MKLVFLEEFGKAFVPKRIRPRIRSYFMKAGYSKVPYRLFGELFYLSVFITAVIYIAIVHPFLVEKKVSLVVFLLTTFLSWAALQLAIVSFLMIFLYIYLEQKIFRRTRELESVLQEFLRYVSENLKGGMSFEKALWDAIRPKFGILAAEIRLAAKKVMTGQDMEQALQEFTDKYNSPILKRTFNLIIEGMKGGHEIADLIDRIELNLRETKELKDEIIATNSTYVIFLTVIALVIAPALFALSFNLLQILGVLSTKLSAAAGGNPNLPLNIGSISVDPQMFIKFSVYSLAVTSAFSAMIVAIIRKGSVRPGLKYIPIYVVVSLVSYYIFKAILLTFFGQLVG